MASGDAERGRLLWEYQPPKAHPIVYAGMLLFAFVLVTGSIENALRANRSVIYAVYAMPLVVTLWLFVMFMPSPVRIHDNGIAPPRPLIARWWRPFIPFAAVRAIYPSYYDVTGAFVSPFASSDGKVTQMGIALEQVVGDDVRTTTIRFTPSRFTMWEPESRGYLEAIDVIKQAWGDRPLVAEAETFTKEQGEAMIAEAQKPFLPFFAIVLLFASSAPILFILTSPWIEMPVRWALPLSLLAPLGVSLRSFWESRKRHRILNRLSKAAEYKRGQRA